MRAGPIDGVIRATWPSGMLAPGLSGPPTSSGSDSRSPTDGARLGREADRHVARLAGRIDPVADVDAGKRRPQRLRHLADRDAERAGQAAIELHVQLRLLALRRQPDVHGAGHLTAASSRDRLRQPCQLLRVGPVHLQLNLLLAWVEAGADRRGHAAERAQIAERMSATTSCWLRDRSVFGSSLTNTMPSSTASPWPPTVV